MPTMDGVIGNMGEPLEYGAEDSQDEEDAEVVVSGDGMNGAGAAAGVAIHAGGRDHWQDDGGVQEVRVAMFYSPRNL